jgi:hypothetical protein
MPVWEVMMSGHRHFVPAPPLRDGDARVVPFRPRAAKTDGIGIWHAPSRDCDPDTLLVERLARYERESQEEDGRGRMLVNGLGFVATVLLIAIGVWLMTNIYDRPSHAFSSHLPPDPGGQGSSASAR